MSAGSELEAGYYIENHVKRVAYQVHWIDPLFKDYLAQVYGDPQKFLDAAAVMVSILPTGEIRTSYPTAGRAISDEFAKPFTDPLTGLPITEYDVKGCLFTESGYRLFQDEIDHPETRREIHRKKDYPDYIYGPLSLKEAVTDQNLTTIAREQGIETVRPLAILKPEFMVYEGRFITIADFVDLFGLSNTEYGLQSPALYIRGYPVTAARSSDMIEGPEHCKIPEIALNWKIARLWNALPPEDYLNLIGQGRRRWQEIEVPKIMEALRVRSEKEFSQKYFDRTLQSVIDQMTQMMLSGLTPSTGQTKDEDGAHNHHTHIQNKTVFRATEVEFAPTVDLSSLSNTVMAMHLRILFEDAHEYLVNAAMYSSADLAQVPMLYQIVNMVSEQCGGNEPLIKLASSIVEELKSDPSRLSCRSESTLGRAINTFGTRF